MYVVEELMGDCVVSGLSSSSDEFACSASQVHAIFQALACDAATVRADPFECKRGRAEFGIRLFADLRVKRASGPFSPFLIGHW